MTRSALLLLSLSTAALAAELVEVVAPQERLTVRVVLLVDVSASMAARLPSAIQAALEIARQGGDQLEVACWAFGSGHARWPAPVRPDSTAPAGWLALPDEEALTGLVGWLSTHPVPDGRTELAGALAASLSESRDKLSVVVISDGMLCDPSPAEAALTAGQAAREKAGLGPAVIACWGVGAEAQALRQLGERGRGGYWREREAPALPLVVPPPVQGSLR